MAIWLQVREEIAQCERRGLMHDAHVPADQLGTAISVIAARDPARANEIKNHISQTQRLLEASQQTQQVAEQQRSAVAQAQWQQWSSAQDKAFDDSVKDIPRERVVEVEKNVLRVAQEKYGVSQEDLVHAYKTNPLLRSAAFQKMMFDVTASHLDRETLAQKIDKSVPPVQRPGTVRAPDSGFTSELKAFRANPTPEAAAKFLMAKRAAAKNRG